MSWTMRIARGASAHSSRRVTADISGHAPPAAVAPPPRPGRNGLVFGARDLGGRLGLMAVALGEQLLLASRAGFRHDVLERFHLFSGEAAPLLDHPHARDCGLDGQRAEDPGEERNDERGAKPEKKGRRMDLHGDPLSAVEAISRATGHLLRLCYALA